MIRVNDVDDPTMAHIMGCMQEHTAEADHSWQFIDGILDIARLSRRAMSRIESLAIHARIDCMRAITGHQHWTIEWSECTNRWELRRMKSDHKARRA